MIFLFFSVPFLQCLKKFLSHFNKSPFFSLFFILCMRKSKHFRNGSLLLFCVVGKKTKRRNKIERGMEGVLRYFIFYARIWWMEAIQKKNLKICNSIFLVVVVVDVVEKGSTVFYYSHSCAFNTNYKIAGNYHVYFFSFFMAMAFNSYMRVADFAFLRFRLWEFSVFFFVCFILYYIKALSL